MRGRMGGRSPSTMCRSVRQTPHATTFTNTPPPRADDLMTGNDARPDGREVAFDDVEIGPADATRDDLEQRLSGLWLRPRKVFYRNPISRSAGPGIKYGCSHRRPPDPHITLSGGRLHRRSFVRTAGGRKCAIPPIDRCCSVCRLVFSRRLHETQAFPPS